MIQPTENIVRAITNLNGNSSWETIIEWLKDSFDAQNKKNNWLTGEDVFRGQGRGLELEAILKYVTNAYEYAENFKKNKAV
jgi:hypothetical protein